MSQNKEAIALLEVVLRVFDGEGDGMFSTRELINQALALLRKEPESGCSHDWVNRKDGYHEGCGPAICRKCGEYGCWCDAKWSDMTYAEKQAFKANGIDGNGHQLEKSLRKEPVGCPLKEILKSKEKRDGSNSEPKDILPGN